MKRFLVSFAFLFLFATAAHAQKIEGVVTAKADGQPLAGATVSIPELGLTTAADRSGRYTLNVPSSARGQTVTITASFDPFRTSRAQVTIGSDDIRRDFALAVAFGQEITVGSRAVGAAAEKAVPVDTFTEKQVEKTGATETNQVIQALTPSFNFPRPTITDGTDSVRPATLRGLGPDQMLVLINGKRRHTSALVNVNNSVGRGSTGVDMNAIPASAIGNVEILRDGAAAQYGSDAIAGVINLVLKSGELPYVLSVKGGATTHADGELIDTSLSKGFLFGRGSLFTTFEFRNRGETNRAGIDPRDQIRLGDKFNNPVRQPNHHWGDSYAKDMMTFFNAVYPLSEDESQHLYAFGGWSRRDGKHGGFYRRGLDDRNWPQIYPLGFLPLIRPKIFDASLAAGTRGSLATWFYDGSLQWGHNEFEFHLSDTLNTSLGPNMPPNKTQFYAGALEFNHLVGNFDLSKPFTITGLAGPLNIAAGVEWRRENFQQKAGERDSWIDGGVLNQFGRRAAAGAQVFPGYRPSDESDIDRDSRAVYLDLEGDILTPLRLGLALRFEDFDDFGSTTNYKLTARYQPLQQLVLRGAVNTGFRAPSLAQAYFSSTSTTFLPNAQGVLTPFEVRTFPVHTPQAIALGAKPLEPEESRQYSAGIVWDPLPTLEVSVDAYRIDIEDRIALSGNFTGARIRALLEPFNASGGRFFTNAIDTRTEGWDVVSTYRLLNSPMGAVTLSAAYNHNDTEITGRVPTPPQLAGFEEVLFDRVVTRLTTCAQPQDNFRATADWEQDRWSGNVRTSMYGEYCSFTNPPAQDQTFSREWLTDLEVGYKLSNHYSFALGVQNAFDRFPDRNIGADANEGMFTYPRNSPFGMNGRFVYGRVTFTY